MVPKATEGWLNRNITVGVASQQHTSFLRLYHEFTAAGASRIFPHLTVNIDVEKGRVRGVTWDDACLFCGGFECVPITYNYAGVIQNETTAGQPVGGCHITTEECLTKPAVCDLLLYVVWSGTDSKGIAFQSAASRFSMFPAQDLRNRLTRAANEAVKVVGAENNPTRW